MATIVYLENSIKYWHKNIFQVMLEPFVPVAWGRVKTCTISCPLDVTLWKVEPQVQNYGTGQIGSEYTVNNNKNAATVTLEIC